MSLCLKKRKALKFDLGMLDKLLADLQNRGIKTVYPFFDGEIFVNPESYEILRRIRKELPEVFILFHTNGVLLDNKEKRSAVIETADQVIFSIDGATSGTYLKYRKGGDFEKAFRNMSDLISERDRSGKKYPLVDWKYLVFRWNSSRRELKHARKLAQEAGVDRLIFMPTIRPFWGISLYHLLIKGIAQEKIGRLYADRKELNLREKRVDNKLVKGFLNK